MSETVFWTVLLGFVTYVLGQLVLKFVIEPVQEFRKTVGAIANALVLHANVIHNPGVPSAEVMTATSDELRKLSSQLLSHLYLIPCYVAIAFIFRLPKRTLVTEASTYLIGLSNSVFRATGNVYEDNAARVTKISDALGIAMNPADRLPTKSK